MIRARNGHTNGWKKQLTRTAKETFTKEGSSGLIIAGTVGAQSTREAILLSKDAAAAGADFVLILPPSYYPGIMTPDAIQGFFEDVSLETRRRVRFGLTWLFRSLMPLQFPLLSIRTRASAQESTWTRI